MKNVKASKAEITRRSIVDELKPLKTMVKKI
jgi:hypothetical protein